MREATIVISFLILPVIHFGQQRIVVASDGSGDFTSVQAAFDAIPSGNEKPYTVFVKKGIYKEVVIVDARKNHINLIGEDQDSTIITFNNHAGLRQPNGDTLNTWTCATFFVYGNDFSARNITFNNNAGFTAGQAVALRVEGNRASFFNCKMTGFQDVLFLSGSGVKHFFRDCYIEGTTDFIFGAATAVFENCHIHSKKNSHVTAASTNSIIPYGFVFFDCKLTADSNINKVSLGRPWTPTASVTYINCWMGNHIIPEGWNNWRNPANEATARYAEYNSQGPGANPASRVKWARQLAKSELENFDKKKILGDWDPEVGENKNALLPAPARNISSGVYTNPVIHADYSDPDVVRVGDDYYMTASSFNHVPGLPILHSTDLVHWNLIGHALKELVPKDHFSKVRHGGGVWAPSIRYHKGEFRIYYPDPDFGIYLVTSEKITGPWSEPRLILEGKGLIDPCPLLDDDGKAYLVHAFAGSRAGVKSVIVVREMNSEGTEVIGDPVIVYDGHGVDPTVEGPKFYKRNGHYYIFAPAGGVSTGWQTVLRSKNVFGPYERRVVMDQGSTAINGPHQGAWVDTKNGEHWFLHFQDKEAYGRIVHLQPMQWKDDWPVIGIDKDRDGKGKPVSQYSFPSLEQMATSTSNSDEFNSNVIGLQWQWQANPSPYWAMPFNGSLRLYTQTLNNSDLGESPALLMQKFPSEEFEAMAKIDFKPAGTNDRVGLLVYGSDYAYLAFRSNAKHELEVVYASKNERSSKEDVKVISTMLPNNKSELYLKLKVSTNAVCTFSYSIDGKKFITHKTTFTAKPGKWVGAKFGLFASTSLQTNDRGYADVDWVRVSSNKNEL